MPFIFDEPFTGYPIGFNVNGTNGWFGSGGSVGADPNAIPSGRLYFGNPLFNISQFFAPVGTAYLYFSLNLNTNVGPNGLVISVQNSHGPSDNFPRTLLTFGVGNNMGANLNGPVGGVGTSNFLTDPVTLLLSNSVNQTGFSFCAGIWYFCSLVIIITDVNHESGPDTIGVGGNLFVNGTQVCNGEIADTGINVTAVATGEANFNQIKFFQPSGDGGSLGNITLSTVDAYPYPPSPPTAIYGRVSQSVVEWIKNTTNGNARISEGVVEYVKTIPTENARVSQAVLELITKNGLFPTSGWQVKEI